jgi:hypothetical protein
MTIQRNVREQNENARPGIVSLPSSVAAYDTAACRGATIGKALAIRGEQAERSCPEVETWLRNVRLLP